MSGTVGINLQLLRERMSNQDGSVYTVAVDGAGAAGALDDLTDVVITTPATNDTLKYSGGHWINSAGGGGGGNKPSLIYDVVADGGADPNTSGGRELSAQIDAGFAAGYPVYIPANVNWTYDVQNHGPLVIPAGLGIFGPPGARSILSGLNKTGTSAPVADDLVHLTGDDAFIANMHLYTYKTLLITHTTGAQTMDGAASGFTVNCAGGDIATFPTSGAGYVVAISVAADESTPSMRFTYTTKSGSNLTGCNWLYGESVTCLYHTWSVPSGTNLALFPSKGAPLRALNDSQYLNIDNVEVENGLDGMCWGDDEDWKVALVNMTSGSPNVTWASGDTFPVGMGATTWVSVVGAGSASVLGNILGTDSAEVGVTTRTDSTHLVLDTNAGATVTNAVMVWGGSAATQGGGGGATFSSMERLFVTNVGRYGLALFPNSDNPDLGNYKFGHMRMLSKYGDTAWLSRASGIQGTGAVKVNGFNRGLDMGNGSPGTPSGSSTANFNWDVFATESHALHGIVMGDQRHPRFPCVSTIAGIQISKIKLQCAQSVDKWPVMIDGLIQSVMIDKVYMLATQGSRTSCYFLRGGDHINIGTTRIKGNATIAGILLRSSNASAVNLSGPIMCTDQVFTSAGGWWYKMSSSDDGSTLDSPSAAFMEGRIFPGDCLPDFTLRTGLGVSGGGSDTATAWVFSLRQQRGFILDIWAQWVANNLNVTQHRRVMVSKDTAGGADTLATMSTPTADVGTAVAPTIAATPVVASPLSTITVTVKNNDSHTMTGRMWGTFRGRIVMLEVSGNNAGLQNMVIDH